MESFMQTTGENIKICVLTGATSGIGRATTLQLCKFNTQLILLGRNQANGSALRNKICGSYGEEKSIFIQTDIANPAEVRNAATQIKSHCPRVDILVNNAGARFNDCKQNNDGIELTFATNHLGHFLLTQLLLDTIKNAPGGRIITVSSDVHRAYAADFDYVLAKSNYDRKAAYGRSKLANLLFTYELARRLAETKIMINAVHPGMVASNFAKNNGLLSWAKHLIYHFLRRELITPSRAAETITYLALSDQVRGVTGQYFFNKQPINSSPESYDLQAAKELWNLSLRLCNIANTNI
jgi:NAD(P)-dependent dehydrogenase (short-subunit alcohol dehydrogenase family)